MSTEEEMKQLDSTFDAWFEEEDFGMVKTDVVRKLCRTGFFRGATAGIKMMNSDKLGFIKNNNFIFGLLCIFCICLAIIWGALKQVM